MTLEPMRVMTWLQWEKERAWSCESCSRTSLERAWPGMRLQSCLRTDSFEAVELMFCIPPCLVKWGSSTPTSFSNDARRPDSFGMLRLLS